MSLFCYALLFVHSSFAIILKRKINLVALLLLSYKCIAAINYYNYTQKKKFSQYLCFLIKSTILHITLSNFLHELYYCNFTFTCSLRDK